jgi:hypothetical protein
VGWVDGTPPNRQVVGKLFPSRENMNWIKYLSKISRTPLPSSH